MLTVLIIIAIILALGRYFLPMVGLLTLALILSVATLHEDNKPASAQQQTLEETQPLEEAKCKCKDLPPSYQGSGSARSSTPAPCVCPSTEVPENMPGIEVPRKPKVKHGQPSVVSPLSPRQNPSAQWA